jgi:hypothetical protein
MLTVVAMTPNHACDGMKSIRDLRYPKCIPLFHRLPSKEMNQLVDTMQGLYFVAL